MLCQLRELVFPQIPDSNGKHQLAPYLLPRSLQIFKDFGHLARDHVLNQDARFIRVAALVLGLEGRPTSLVLARRGSGRALHPC